MSDLSTMSVYDLIAEYMSGYNANGYPGPECEAVVQEFRRRDAEHARLVADVAAYKRYVDYLLLFIDKVKEWRGGPGLPFPFVRFTFEQFIAADDSAADAGPGGAAHADTER